MYDGSLLRSFFNAAAERLKRDEHAINRINTFPIPDGDSGTNMRYTIEAAAEGARTEPSSRADLVAKKASRSALLAARGNSGIILSQIVAGLARGLSDKEHFTGQDLAHALGVAAESAYKSVAEPVEGTILTVIRSMADAAREVPPTAPVEAVLERALAAGRDALARTPDLLPRLKETGVVDAGGLGLLSIVEAMRDALTGPVAAVTTHEERRGTFVPRGGTVEAPNVPPDAVYGYEVQCLVLGEGLDLPAITAFCRAEGESVLVVGDESEAKVHVHTRHPQRVVDFLVTQGNLAQLTFENLDAQAAAFPLPAEAEEQEGVGA
jgi:DAK2 domain fusion protein YloV